MDERVNELEKRVDRLEIKYDGIDKRLDKIEGNTSKIIWILITAVALALLNSVLKGGVIS